MIAVAAACVFLAGVVVVALDHPVAVLGALFTAGAAIMVIYFPLPALVMFLFLSPFSTAIFYLAERAALPAGPLTYWKDAVVVALFLRALVHRVREDGRFPLTSAGDNFLYIYVLAWCALAIVSPRRPTVAPALGLYVEGPLLFLAIRFLRPTRRQLWWCVAAMLAAAAVMGGAALVEWLGPRADFHTWYGAPKPSQGSSIFFFGGGGYRSGSFLNSPLILAFYLAGAVAFAVGVTAARSRSRTAIVLCASLCAAGLILTFGRSGYIGGGIGVVIALMMAIRNPAIRVSLTGIVLIVSGATAASYLSADGGEALVRQDSAQTHLDTLQADLRLLEAKPYGYGLGVTDRFTSRTSDAIGATESSYMAKALEGGVAALVLFLIAMFTIFMRLHRLRLEAIVAGDPDVVAIVAGAMGAMTAILLASLFIGVLELVVEAVLWGAPALALSWPLTDGRSRGPILPPQ